MSLRPPSRAGVPAAAAGLLLSLLGAATAVAAGPDATVLRIPDIANFGSSGGVRGYALGFTACNEGTAPVGWCDEPGGCPEGLTDAGHPVLAQNLYRLKNGRFEQIGMSWLKHGVNSTNNSDAACGTCVEPPGANHQLGVGCTDTYGAAANGARPLGMRSEVDATHGSFTFPYTERTATIVYEQRLKVLESDVDSDLNPGAFYAVEAQFVTADDAAAGNGLNNASYQQVTTMANAPFDLTLSGAVVRRKSALWGWKAADPAVEIATIDFRTGPADLVERFEVARRVTGGGGSWHYEYVIRNMNSRRAARGLEIRFPAGAVLSSVGFRDIDHHSGEPYATNSWNIDPPEAGRVRWSTVGPGVDPDANALRWATAFNFWFDADQGPAGITHRLELFEWGCPAGVLFQVPNGIVFADDFECGAALSWSYLEP
jgi:hypothetical protein